MNPEDQANAMNDHIRSQVNALYEQNQALHRELREKVAEINKQIVELQSKCLHEKTETTHAQYMRSTTCTVCDKEIEFVMW